MNGLNTMASEYPVKETIDRMISIIEAQGWHLFARIDHAEHTRKKGLELRPTELILFGNPKIRNTADAGSAARGHRPAD
ncbi:MAG: DUF302 domain-containing protein [Methylophilaceae bacterium]